MPADPLLDQEEAFLVDLDYQVPADCLLDQEKAFLVHWDFQVDQVLKVLVSQWACLVPLSNLSLWPVQLEELPA